jgi:hypothetical protein
VSGEDASEEVPDPEALRSGLKQSTAALKHDGVPFALAGGYALWVHGAPEPMHDVDLIVPETEIEAAAESLTAAGFEIERPPEDWLFKAYADGAMVDVLHRLTGNPVTAELVARAGELEVLGVRIPVLPPTEIMIAKLLALSEHYCDFAALLPTVRAIREQLDWHRIRSETKTQPFAEAFLGLSESLGLAPVTEGSSGR